MKIGIARAGNVIGGGDWSEDRLIPDCIKSWSLGRKVDIFCYLIPQDLGNMY